MERLGHGLQYTVYDAGDRVYKRPATRGEIRWRTLRQRPSLLWRPSAWTANVERMIQQRRDVIAALERRRIDPSVLGNVVFQGEAMWQDKLVPLGRVLTPDAAGRQCIDQFAAFTRRCWAQGMAETTFNFTVNHGLDAAGRIVILDIGEVTFDKDEMVRDIRSRLWERAWSFTTDLHPGLRAYYAQTMEAIMTEEHVEALWLQTRDASRHRLDHLERPPVHALRRATEVQPTAGIGRE